MSYSFTIRAADKAAAKAAVAAKFDEVNASQKCHERDRQQALAAADAFIDLVADDGTQDIVVNMAGYLSGSWENSDVIWISTASISVSASLTPRQA